MQHPSSSDDFSKFLVHLTRNYKRVPAEDNLISILNTKTIEARNVHCLFNRDLIKLVFTPRLQRRFNVVCFTEAPLPQIKRLVAQIPGRRIYLKPYGLVFDKYFPLEKGANPAIYINARGTKLREYLLDDFRRRVAHIKTFWMLERRQNEFYNSIIQYYALINIIRDRHDFAWEREWRLIGNLTFAYHNLVAIIAEDPEKFECLYDERLARNNPNYIHMLPIISPEWSYEDIVQQMSIKVWNNALSEKPTEG